MIELIDINNSLKADFDPVQSEQVRKAVLSLNRRKATDAHGVTAEHFVYGGEELIETVKEVINKIFAMGKVPDSMKLGILTPVYKKKGSKNDAKKLSGNNSNAHYHENLRNCNS